MRWKHLLVLLSLPLAALDWPQWRGPDRTGISKETGLLKSWPAGGPKQVWKATGLGKGFSSMAVAGGRIYTQGQRGQQEFVIALDAKSGKKLWETPSGAAFDERRGSGPRGTPTVDGSVLYAIAADGTLVCLETATGKKIWGFNMLQKFGGSQINWGISESPLVDGERLIVMPGGRGASIVALNKKNGETIWKAGSDTAGYSSAILANSGNVRLVLALSSRGAIGVRADNGELLWTYDKIANNVANIATPIFHDGHAFFSTDYGTGCALLKLDGQRMSEVYFNRDMRNHYSTSVLVGQHLYGYSGNVLTAMDFKTGQVAWRNRSVGKGSVIFADGHLYAMGEDGEVGLIEATPEAYREKSRFSIPRGDFNTWTPPAISDGMMYLREQDNLYCFDIRATAK